MIGPIKPFSSIGKAEIAAAIAAMEDHPLSDYLAGKARGGYHVCALEDAWCETFETKHAIAVNSATSGLLAAAFAVGLKSGDQFVCPAMTMSATCAAPMFTGATPFFCDVNDRYFSLDPASPSLCLDPKIRAVFLVHLFGIAIDEMWWTGWAHQNGMKVIVDASQAPFTQCDGVYAGTVADIGVFSLNYHKPIHAGEGGVIVTDDDDLAAAMRRFINHGENGGDRIGLNLRMTEITAAIALAQLKRGEGIVAGRIRQAEAIISAIGDIPGLTIPAQHPDCRNVYYIIPFLIEKNRTEFCGALRAEGVPIVEGYVDPLYRMSAFKEFARPCPVAEDLHDRRLLYFENSAWDPTAEQIRLIGDAFKRAAETFLKDR